SWACGRDRACRRVGGVLDGRAEGEGACADGDRAGDADFPGAPNRADDCARALGWRLVATPRGGAPPRARDRAFARAGGGGGELGGGGRSGTLQGQRDHADGPSADRISAIT